MIKSIFLLTALAFTFILQSFTEIMDTAQHIVLFASALLGFLSGWFGKKAKDKINQVKQMPDPSQTPNPYDDINFKSKGGEKNG